MTTRQNLKGTFTAIVTPFADGKIDISSFEKLLKQQLDGGMDGFVINGTTAESPVLNEKEKQSIFDIAKSFTGDTKTLIMGTGSNDTAKTIEDSQKAEKMGADAILVVVPYYNKPPQRGLYQHFKKVAESVTIPTILYNVPGRTITALQADTIKALSEVKGIRGIKEASGKIDFATEIIRACGKDFIMLSGDDGTYVEFLDAGGHGVISVASHIIPKQMVQWKKWKESGEIEKARQDIQKYSRLIDLLFVEANPIPVKMALHFMGLLKSAELRLPLVEMDVKLAKDLKAEMQNTGVL